MLGFFNLIDGIAALAKASVYVAGARYVFGDLRAWGWVVLILGILQLIAALGVVVGNQIARWFGVAVIGVNAIAQLFFLPGYPLWSLMIIAGDVVALWGLCAYGSRENVRPPDSARPHSHPAPSYRSPRPVGRLPVER